MKKTFKYMAAMVIVGMFLSTSAIGQTAATGKNYVDKDKNGKIDLDEYVQFSNSR